MRASQIILFASGLCLSCSSSSSAVTSTSSGSGGAASSTTLSASSVASASSSGSGGAGATGGGGSGGGSGGAEDTYMNFAEPFFAMYCLECHGAGKTHDFTTLGNITKAKDLIRCGVAPILESSCTGNPAPKQFPISDATDSNPKPSDADRNRIVAWIDNGLP